VKNCLLCRPFWLPLQIHNSRFTEIVANQTLNLWKFVFCPDHLVTITNTQLKIYQNCWESNCLLSWPFGHYYKYTTQDLLKLLRIKLPTCAKLFIVLTIWLLLQIHNWRFTKIVDNQIVYCPDHLVTITKLKIYQNCWESNCLLSWPFGYYYKYTTQDLLNLLRIKLPTCEKLFFVLTTWLLLQMHNSRCTLPYSPTVEILKISNSNYHISFSK